MVALLVNMSRVLMNNAVVAVGALVVILVLGFSVIL